MQGLESQEQSFSNTLQGNYATQFGNQEALMGKINNSLSPIIQAGPNQQGFNAAESAALNTQALDTTGANYANAARAVGGQLAGQNSSSGLESGIAQQVKASLAGQAAGQLSGEQLGITNANYATGRQNYENAIGGGEQLAGEYNPTGYAGLANGANNQAFGQANEINQQNNQKTADIVGAAVDVAAAPFTGGMSLSGLGSSLGGGGSSGGGGGSIPSDYTSGGGGDDDFLAGGL